MTRVHRVATLHPRAWVAMRRLYGTNAQPVAITAYGPTPWKARRRCYGWAYVHHDIPQGGTVCWMPHIDYTGPTHKGTVPLDQYSYAHYYTH